MYLDFNDFDSSVIRRVKTLATLRINFRGNRSVILLTLLRSQHNSVYESKFRMYSLVDVEYIYSIYPGYEFTHERGTSQSISVDAMVAETLRFMAYTARRRILRLP
jgi:hypothetical protein